jgi:hypothetical protein
VTSLVVAFIAIVCVLVYVLVALVCHDFGNGLGEGLTLRRHRVELGVFRLCDSCMVIVGQRCTLYLGNVVTDYLYLHSAGMGKGRGDQCIIGFGGSNLCQSTMRSHCRGTTTTKATIPDYAGENLFGLDYLYG